MVMGFLIVGPKCGYTDDRLGCHVRGNSKWDNEHVTKSICLVLAILFSEKLEQGDIDDWLNGKLDADSMCLVMVSSVNGQV